MDKQAVISMCNISKSFGVTRALDGVNLDIYEKEIHAILGQNGAGKSTLVKILDNVHQEFEGEVYYKGQEISHKSMSDFFKKVLGVVHQEFPLVPHLTVAENIYLGDFPKNKYTGQIQWKKLFEKTEALLKSLNIRIDPRAQVSKLTMGERQLISIAHAVAKKPEVLIFDEATSALTEKEVESIFELLFGLLEKGVAVIYISHKIEEILRISHRVTVLRDGKSITTKQTGDTDKTDLIKMMAGKDVSQQFPKRIPCESCGIALEVDRLTGEGFSDCSFSIRRGEILGIAGLVGSGRPELLKAIFGAQKAQSGKLYANGKELNIRRPKDAIENKIFFIPSDRRKEGIFKELSIRDNMTTALLDAYTTFGWIDHAKESRVVEEYIKKLSTKTTGESQLIKQLSGGNQQKVIIARWLSGDGEVFLFDEPTRGLDVGVKYDVYELLNSIKAEGKAVVMISSELPELLAMSDRIIVMYEGRIVAEIENRELDQETVLTAMMNQHQ